MWHSEKVMLLACSLFLTLFFCNEYPAAPKYNGIGDCTKATIPQGLQLNGNAIYASVEIYDYEKNLINTIQKDGPLFEDSLYPQYPINISNFTLDFYWNGLDMNGNKVDNGKYIAKISIISKQDTSCSCGEVIIH